MTDHSQRRRGRVHVTYFTRATLDSGHNMSTTVIDCDKQNDNRRLTTPGDDNSGRGQVLSTVDRRLSSVDHMSSLYTAQWSIGRGGVVHRR